MKEFLISENQIRQFVRFKIGDLDNIQRELIVLEEITYSKKLKEICNIALDEIDRIRVRISMNDLRNGGRKIYGDQAFDFLKEEKFQKILKQEKFLKEYKKIFEQKF